MSIPAKRKNTTIENHGEKKRTDYSIFGKLRFWRPYFYVAGKGGARPVDEQLSLGDDCYSKLRRVPNDKERQTSRKRNSRLRGFPEGVDGHCL